MKECGPGAAENPARKWRTVVRIEHSLLDGISPSDPSDLRPPFATTPYHKKSLMFQFAIDDGQYVPILLVQSPKFWCDDGSWCKARTCGFAAPIALSGKISPPLVH